MICNLTTTPRDFRNVLMGLVSKPAIWSTCGELKWSKEGEYKDENLIVKGALDNL